MTTTLTLTELLIYKLRESKFASSAADIAAGRGTDRVTTGGA
jgi:hypothetical protein